MYRVINEKNVVKTTAIGYNNNTVLGGEIVVPCHLQTTTAGLNACGGRHVGSVDRVRSVDTKVSCNGVP